MEGNPGFLRLVAEARSRIREVTVEEVQQRRLAHDHFHLVDVREDGEWQRGYIPGARHLSRGVIERDIELAIPSRTAEIVLYCGGGNRSVLAADTLQQMGYQNVCSLAGGWRRWREADYPIEKTAPRRDVTPPAVGGLWP